jgi:hypothetical protein
MPVLYRSDSGFGSRPTDHNGRKYAFSQPFSITHCDAAGELAAIRSGGDGLGQP